MDVLMQAYGIALLPRGGDADVDAQRRESFLARAAREELLCEKKARYMRFIGCAPGLIKAVLD